MFFFFAVVVVLWKSYPKTLIKSLSKGFKSMSGHSSELRNGLYLQYVFCVLLTNQTNQTKQKKKTTITKNKN